MDTEKISVNSMLLSKIIRFIGSRFKVGKGFLELFAANFEITGT